MDEKVYRQSRLCRLMGNPIAFAFVDAVSQNKELTPSEIAHAVGRSVSRVSHSWRRYGWRRSSVMTPTGDGRAIA